MRIALCTRHAWPSIGGMEAEVRTLAGALAADHEVAVFAHRIGGGDEWRGPFDREAAFAPFADPDSGVITRQLRLTASDMVGLTPSKAIFDAIRGGGRRRLPAELWHAWMAGRRFARQFGDVEVLHRFGGNRMALAAVFAARRLQAPIVITPNAHPGQWDDDWLSALTYRSADLVVATGAADAQTYLRLGVDPSRVEICSIANREVMTGGGARLRGERRIDGPLVLFVGVRRPYKGVDVLRSAARLLLDSHPRARVAFVGPGAPLGPDTPPNVMDVGEVDPAQRDAWFDAADVVCLPSTNESWGLAVSEAWSAGVPVVTSDITVLRERVAQAGAGRAVSAEPRALAAALDELLGDPEMRARMGAAGRAQWEKSLSPAAVARRHLEIYDRAANLHRTKPARLAVRETLVTVAGG